MKPFIYRFERKLGLAKQEEQAARQELQLAITERNRILEDLELLKNRISRVEDSIRSHHGNWLIPEVGLRKDYLPVLKEHFLKLTDDLLEAEKRAEYVRAKVVEKRRETQTFEKLREHDWQEYKYDMKREEQKVIDELAITLGSRAVGPRGTES